MKSFMSRLKNWMSEGKYAVVSRFSLASLICLCMLTVGVGNVWG